MVVTRRNPPSFPLRPRECRHRRRAGCLHLSRPGRAPHSNHRNPFGKGGRLRLSRSEMGQRIRSLSGLGLMKDIFCPFREQKKRMVLGNSYIVHIHIDEESYRIVASAKIERYLNEDHPHYKHGDEVDLSSGRRPTSASRLSSTTSIRVSSIRTRFSSTSIRVTR